MRWIFITNCLFETNGHWAPLGRCFSIVPCVSTICPMFSGQINFHPISAHLQHTTWTWLCIQDPSLQLSAFDARSSCHLFRYIPSVVTQTNYEALSFVWWDLYGGGGEHQSSYAARRPARQGRENKHPKEIIIWSDTGWFISQRLRSTSYVCNRHPVR